MNNQDLEFITKYINEDNISNKKIYDFLFQEYEKNLISYKNDINIFGIYFFDILKILTHINLKIRESKNKLIINSLDETNLDRFPYYTVKEIFNGIKINDKIFGKNISNEKLINKIIKKILNFKNIFFNIENIFSTTQLTLDNDKLILLKVKKKNNYISFHNYLAKKKYKIPLLNKQLLDLKKILMESELKFFGKYKNLKISEILEKHILANCEEGIEKLKIKSNYLIIGSGVELKNRIISSIFRQNNKKIIQVVHGDSYGVFDEPVWSRLGDQYNANYILGYGNGYNKHKVHNTFSLNHDIKYFAGTSEEISKLRKKSYKNIDKKNLKFIYFPTSFSGISKRYGPYRDMPDKLYINWQNKLNSTFKKNITFKIHPKEKLNYFYNNNLKTKDGDIKKYFYEYNVLIFDHISTAFNLACSTKNYIIYFDLGTRNLNTIALEIIKKRALYYKINNYLPVLNEIIDDLQNKYINNNYFNNEFIENFCLGNLDKRINLLSEIKNE